MSTERDQGTLFFQCDECSETFECDDDDFHSGWDDAQEDGWRCKKDKDGDWLHFCPCCVADFAEK